MIWKSLFMRDIIFLGGSIMDWIFVSPQNLTCWSPNSQCEGIWRWDLWKAVKFGGGHVGEALHNGISVLIRRGTDQSLLAHSPYHMRTCEDTAGRHLSISQEGGPHWETNLASTLNLEFLACKTLRNKFLLLSHSFCGILWQLKLMGQCNVFVRF